MFRILFLLPHTFRKMWTLSDAYFFKILQSKPQPYSMIHPPSCSTAVRDFSPGIKQPEREDAHSSLYSSFTRTTLTYVIFLNFMCSILCINNNFIHICITNKCTYYTHTYIYIYIYIYIITLLFLICAYIFQAFINHLQGLHFSVKSTF
jgi:hypothetical protein